MTDLLDKILSLFDPDDPTLESEVGGLKSEVASGDVFACELSRIHVDYEWNARRGNWIADIDEIEHSMLPDGDEGKIRQDTPAVVRRYKPSAVSYQLSAREIKKENVSFLADSRELSAERFEFSLVSGFSRYTAIARIAKRLKIEKPTMVVKFEDLSEAEALEMNIRENVGRNSQRVVDTAFQLYNAWRDRGRTSAIWLTPNELGPRVALNPGMVKSLIYIMRNGEPEMLEAWRKCQLEVSHRDIEKLIRAYHRFDHLKEFKMLITKEKPSNGDLSSKHDSYFIALQRAKSFGRVLLRLEQSGFVKVNVQASEQLSNNPPDELIALLGKKLDYERMVEEIINGYRQSAIGSRQSARSDRRPPTSDRSNRLSAVGSRQEEEQQDDFRPPTSDSSQHSAISNQQEQQDDFRLPTSEQDDFPKETA